MTIDTKPNMQELEFTTSEKALITKKINKANKRLIANFVVLLILSIIAITLPSSFLYKLYQDPGGRFNPDMTIIESLGVMPTLIALIAFGAFMFWLTLSHTNYFELKKDLVDNKSLVVEVKVSKVRELTGHVEKEYNVHLEPNEGELRKLTYLRSEFPGLTKGDIIKVTLTKNAHYVFKTVKIG